MPLSEHNDRFRDVHHIGKLRVKVVGSPELALDLIEAERAWAGEVEMLYSNAIRAVKFRQDKAPPESTGP